MNARGDLLRSSMSQTATMSSGSRTGVGGSLATEGYDAERALARLPQVRAHADALIRRLERYVPIAAGCRVLGVGAAQGLYVAGRRLLLLDWPMKRTEPRD
jgi:hypothetical protein